MTGKYDDRGNQIETAYYGIRDNPVMTKDGYFLLVQSFGANKEQLLEMSSYDTNKILVVNSMGFARVAKKYDKSGNLIEITAFDADGKLKVAYYGYARMTRKYDSHGKMTEEAYFGADGKLKALENRVCARTSYRYDATGNQIEECCYGANDTLEVRAARKFNTLRQQVEERYFDLNGKTAKLAGEFQHVTKYSYDSQGNKIEEIYLGIDGERVQGFSIDADKICDRWTAKYDATGKKVETICHVDR